MKKNIHPTTYKPVVFRDINNDIKTLIRSTVDVGKNPKMITWEDGQSYPIVDVQISATSHAFYTQDDTNVDQMGHIAKFHAKYKKK